MNNICKVICCGLIVFSGFGLLAQSALSDEGGWSGGGGDARAIQFKKIGEELSKLLPTIVDKFPQLKNINFKRFTKAVESTQVVTTDKTLKKDDMIKDAVNYPEKHLIIINADRWDALIRGTQRAALVLHEYLGIACGNDRIYERSSSIFEDQAVQMLLDNTRIMGSLSTQSEVDFAIDCTPLWQERCRL